MRNRRLAPPAGLVLAVVALTYLPVLQGGFVWDDLISFVWNDWLTHGDKWKTYIFRGFNFWDSYFRPLVVALFTLQLRVFDAAPGPMHAVSLVLHLINTFLVGLLALRSCAAAGREGSQRIVPMAVAMTLFGLHPAVVEAVAWIGCQFDLVMTLFVLLGLLANAGLRGDLSRPLATGACFFLAACAKESAIAFPLLLLVFDAALQSRQGGCVAPPRLRTLVSRNAVVLAAVFVAGLGYLMFRHWAMGTSALPLADGTIPWLARMQLVSSAYLRYWSLVFAPTVGMAPIHPFSIESFEQATMALLAIDAAALGLVSWALFAAYRRASVTAYIVLALTAALLPVLRILPTVFDSNLIHYRYLTCGLAIACAMLPLLRFPRAWGEHRLHRVAAVVLAAAWVASSATTIRATLPLWSSEVSLWYWALQRHPESELAASQLLGAYLDAGRYAEARRLADRILAEHPHCTNCLINSAFLAIGENNLERAAREVSMLGDREAEIAASGFLQNKYDLLRDQVRHARRQASGAAQGD